MDNVSLPLSGIQHFEYCPRQWWLIHVGRVWNDNSYTADGSYMHANVDSRMMAKYRKNRCVYMKSFPACSMSLGLHGVCDVVEVKGTKMVPIEYKHGDGKNSFECDKVQVVAQAMAIEETCGMHIGIGKIFYFKTRKTEEFSISEEDRRHVSEIAAKMHRMFESSDIPTPDNMKRCGGCSLKGICLPKPSIRDNSGEYLKTWLYAEDS